MKKILRLKYLAMIINIFVTINTLGLIGLGIYRTISTIIQLFTKDLSAHEDFKPGVELAEALDVFLIALVFLVFVIGINILFVRHTDEEYIQSIPKWMRVKNFAELKFLLMEAIIATMFVMFIAVFIQQMESMTWTFLVLPVSILLLSVSLKVLKWKEDR